MCTRNCRRPCRRTSILKVRPNLGNLFYSLKPNYFVGIRTAWTLENETVWRKTHQWGGRLWVGVGLIMAVACGLLPTVPGTVVFFAGAALLGLGPVVYSYLCYRRIKKDQA